MAGIAVTACPANLRPDVMAAVAWLHDSIEDQGVTVEALSERFGPDIARAVLFLSDTETGNRAERKTAARTRLAGAWDWVQTIKVADLISNTASIAQHDPTFAAGYLEEKRMLLDVLTKADPRLVQIARAQLAANPSKDMSTRNHSPKKCHLVRSATIGNNVDTKKLPVPGQAYLKGGLERVVVSVTSQGPDRRDCYVEWRRPVNDMRSWSMWLPSWIRWAAYAELKPIEGKTMKVDQYILCTKSGKNW